MKTKVVAALNALKNGAVNAYTAIKTRVTNIVQTLVSGVVGKFNSLKTTAATIWNNIKTAITHPMETAKNTVGGIIQKMKGFFPLSVGKVFNNIKLPHFNISGGTAPWGIGGKGVKPTIGIDWYKTGAIFMKPTVAGLAESGPEAIVPIDTLWNKLDRIADATSGGNTFNFNITVSGAEDPESYARRLVRQLKMELRMV